MLIEAVVIGASAGAIDALGAILPELPADLGIPVIIVVHIPPNRPSLLVDVFAPKCRVLVAEPDDKRAIEPGIWFAPADYHLLIEANRCFALSDDEPVNFSRPSIDVLFESAAAAYGPRVAAVVLTGANDDGARGASAIRDAGGLVIVQDPASAESPIMPRAAIEHARPQRIQDIVAIAASLCALSQGSLP